MRHRKYYQLIAVYLLATALLLGGKVSAEGQAVFYDFRMRQPLELAPYHTRLLSLNDELNALSIINGKIVCFQEKGANWIELQRFGPDNMNFTTFEIKDLNGDKTPEIVAGTEDPGLIYVYTWDNGQWGLLNYGKHVWSTITKIIIGKFSNSDRQEFLVQNDEGFLFLLRASSNSLDLIWKSPSVWQPISDAATADLNNDSLDEIFVVYKTGGIGILKLENNSVVSVWENFPWGKILGITVGDWDADQNQEIIFSTSQKVLYILGENQAEFGYEGQFSEFGFIIEKLSFMDSQEEAALIAANTTGMLKILQYNREQWRWVEKFTKNTGRIIQLVRTNPEQVALWSANRKVMTLTSYKSLFLRVLFQEEQYQLKPNAISYNNQIYIAPQALADFSGLKISYDTENQVFSITSGERNLKIAPRDPGLVWIDDWSKIALPVPAIFIDNQLYLPLDLYRSLLKINLDFNASDRTISISSDSGIF
ncbi:MAG: copper amine oxidase N-terminal domain-containing protein [Firmicutes bacterium]|nr:copper amine oxidase N-terminal domain-containing protein [Bacillota bacterium]